MTPPDIDPNLVVSGWTPLLLTLGLGGVIVLIAFSMSRHMRRVRPDLPYQNPARAGITEPTDPEANDPEPSAPEPTDENAETGVEASAAVADPATDDGDTAERKPPSDSDDTTS